LVGYDIDVIMALAKQLGVRLEIYEAATSVLERYIATQRIDIAVGGILDSPSRSALYNSTDGYQQVHRALVVHDDRVGSVQDRAANAQRSLRIATADSEPVSDDVVRALSVALSENDQPARISIVRLREHAEFLRDTTSRVADALLTTAEGGAAWSVVYPHTSMLPILRDRVPTECVMLVAGNDADLREYLQQWISQERSVGFFDRLFAYWIAR
jgi:ABC-type amino acid transport substrate-binding protein